MDTTTSSALVAKITDAKQVRKVAKAIERHGFAMLATTSPTSKSHAAGVVYEAVDGTVWIHVMRSSRKARNIVANPTVGVCIPFRRLPAGPPYTVHFQAKARLVERDDPEVVALLDRGRLKAIAGHGALDEPNGCFIAVAPLGRVHSFGLGVWPLDLIRDPIHSGGRTIELPAPGEVGR